MVEFEDRSNDGFSSLKLLYDISRELVSSLDLSTLLTRILYLSTNSLEASSGSIIILNEQGQPIDSAMIQGTTLKSQTTERLAKNLENGLAGWVLKNQKPALVRDTSDDERWLRRPEDRHLTPMSVICVPLMVGKNTVGVMTLSHAIAGFFSEDQLNLLQSIADQAAIAALNARLYETSKRKADVMQALFESAAYINESLELEDVLNRILEQILYGLKVEAVTLALIDPQNQDMVFRAATGVSQEKVIGLRLNFGEGIAGWVARNGRGVIVPNVEKDDRFYPRIDRATGFTTRAVAAAPIISRGNVIGVLEALNPQKSFDQEDLEVLQGIGTLAGTAITHARLFRQVDHARQRFRDLFEDSPAPILITDMRGYILAANQQALQISGFSESNLLNTNIKFFHRPDIHVVGRNYKKLKVDQASTYESTIFTRKGKEIPVEVNVRCYYSNNEKRMQWILQDITQRKKADNLRIDLMQMIYHDLRSPLANVLSSLDLIAHADPVEHDPSIHAIIEIALRSTQRVQRLASSLLDTSMMQDGQVIGIPERVSIPPLLREAVSAVKPYLDSKSHQIAIDLPQAPLNIMVDEDIIRRVVINLLENANKYSPDNSTITLGASRNDGAAYIWVQDNGPGIPEEEIPNIFDKFTRAQDSSTKKIKGLGLGLAFCKLAVENHGGKIWVESKFGEGSRFTFSLPAVD